MISVVTFQRTNRCHGSIYSPQKFSLKPPMSCGFFCTSKMLQAEISVSNKKNHDAPGSINGASECVSCRATPKLQDGDCQIGNRIISSYVYYRQMRNSKALLLIFKDTHYAAQFNSSRPKLGDRQCTLLRNSGLLPQNRKLNYLLRNILRKYLPKAND
jgi:hypothetical protein